MTKSRFLIAATHSGCGKTTFSLGLMRLLTQQGRKVQPFKCGPDYIDTQFHAVATGHPSINLDTFMSSEAHVREVFRRYDSPSDVSIVEGVMGLFDGYSKDLGSSAHIATPARSARRTAGQCRFLCLLGSRHHLWIHPTFGQPSVSPVWCSTGLPPNRISVFCKRLVKRWGYPVWVHSQVTPPGDPLPTPGLDSRGPGDDEYIHRAGC